MTLQPGPLSPGMVSLLTAGRSVLDGGGRSLVTFAQACDGDMIVEYSGLSQWLRWADGPIKYIGERSDDGWITAPPGGWGSNPVPGRVVHVRSKVLPNSYGTVLPSEEVVWSRVIAFRLVEEAGTGGESGSFSQEAKIPTAQADEGVVVLQTTRGPIDVDASIAPIVAALNAAGVETIASCSGHGHRPGNIALRDGRELIIARDFNEGRLIDALFPVNSAGELIAAARAKEAGE